jgi:hypothetical protein
VVAFDIDRYASLAGRLDTTSIDFGCFSHEPIDEATLRCLRYMHDVEYHTVCYLRDLLVTRAHKDPEVTTFLTIWAYEETWHGEAIGRVLAAHGEPAARARVGGVRSSLGWRDHVRPILSQAGSVVTKDFTAVHMAWGAINEWTTQSGYAQLARRSGHPVLTELLRLVMRQEGRHIDFYTSQARTRLASSAAARRLARWALGRFWRPVGSSLMPEEEVRFMARHLFGDVQGRAAAARVDRQVSRLPGLDGMRLLTRAVDELGAA